MPSAGGQSWICRAERNQELAEQLIHGDSRPVRVPLHPGYIGLPHNMAATIFTWRLKTSRVSVPASKVTAACMVFSDLALDVI